MQNAGISSDRNNRFSCVFSITIHICLRTCPFFQDVNAATAVHHTLQGAVIPSSGRGGMRIQYPLPFHS
jgi:hypothetical protein